jgi:hypothetical protein
LNSVDLPTLGRPTMATLLAGLAGDTALARRQRSAISRPESVRT